MFECPNCKQQAPKLIASGRGLGLFCPTCLPPDNSSYDGLRHMSGNNKYSPKMTMIERRHLECRVPGPDNRAHYTDVRLRTKSHG